MSFQGRRASPYSSELREQIRREREQQSEWQAAGCCRRCGAKLGVMDKLMGRKECKEHR